MSAELVAMLPIGEIVDVYNTAAGARWVGRDT